MSVDIESCSHSSPVHRRVPVAEANGSPFTVRRKLIYVRRIPLVLALLVSLIPLTSRATAAPGDIALASTSDLGIKGNDQSGPVSLSRDGKSIAFVSLATNLDPADTDSLPDVYVKDLVSGDTILASTSDAGVKGSGSSHGPILSEDGTKVAFYSSAANLDPADLDSVRDVYVKDLVSGDLVLASTSDSGVKGNADSFSSDISGDGTKVAFSSVANTLDPADLDLVSDVYVKDVISGDVALASATASGVKGNAISSQGSLSGDGTRVAFFSGATNLDPSGRGGVFVKNLLTGDINLASTSDAGTPGNDGSVSPDLSDDGRTLAFSSRSTNLDPDDADTNWDIYVKNLTNGDIQLASTSDSDVKGIPDSSFPSISADGTRVAFESEAFNLDPGDPDTFIDIYVKDLTSGDVILASTSSNGEKGNREGRFPDLSGAGTKVGFESISSNLHPADTDAIRDVYVKEPGGSQPTPPCGPSGSFSDDLEPLPDSGWTFQVARNDGPSATWAQVSDPFARSSSHSFTTDAVAPAIKDDRLIAPPQDLSSVSVLTFWHRFSFENGFDGGVLELSSDGGETWNDVLAGGGSFTDGGYNGTIGAATQNPIGGRSAWTGVSPSINAMSRVQVSLGAFAGNDVRVRWRMGADNRSVTTGTGWWLDDIQFNNLTVNCPPIARDDFASTVNGIPVTINVLANDSEPNGNPMTITEVTQPAHGTAVLNPNQTVRYDPVCAFQGTDTFTYTISDGQGGTDTATVSVRARKTSRRGSFPC